MEREKIITLISEDMKHNSLINGLYGIGLTDNDNYLLKIDLIVADMMGVSPIPDAWLELYQKTMLNIPHSLTQEQAYIGAVNLFDALTDVLVKC